MSDEPNRNGSRWPELIETLAWYALLAFVFAVCSGVYR